MQRYELFVFPPRKMVCKSAQCAFCTLLRRNYFVIRNNLLPLLSIMANPLMILPLMLRAKRPSRMDDMKAVSLPFWIRKGYDGLTFFGTIITHNEKDAKAFDQRMGALKNHEMIHLYQARSTHDSWICFYWKYFWFWLKACRYRKHLKNASYLLNPFELEAYGHMYEHDYLQPEGKAEEWRELAKMTLEERLQYYRENIRR